MGRLFGSLDFTESDVILGVVRARSVHKIGYGHNRDCAAAYDLTKSHVLTQYFGLTRRIHCWDAAFTRSFTPGGFAEYYFRLGVHDQKEIYFERGTRSQSFAGI